MVTNSEIFSAINSAAPFALAAEWDNVGLLLDMKKPSERLLFSLDLTPGAVREAAGKGCGAIVCHHPAIFGPGLRRLDGEDPVVLAAGFGISVFAAHTNWDAASGGVNDQLAALLGLGNPVPLGSMGRAGEVQECSPAEFAERVKEALCTPSVMLLDAGEPVRRVAVVGGSGGDFAPAALAAGCQLLVTGECKHHEALLALRLGVSVVAAGHFETENPSVPALLSAVQAALGPRAECLICEGAKAPFRPV